MIYKREYTLDIKELVDLVNQKLSTGMSTVAIEKEMGLGKDTLRKKLNRSNYKYHKELKQYITKDSIAYNNIPYCKEPQEVTTCYTMLN